MRHDTSPGTLSCPAAHPISAVAGCVRSPDRPGILRHRFGCFSGIWRRRGRRWQPLSQRYRPMRRHARPRSQDLFQKLNRDFPAFIACSDTTAYERLPFGLEHVLESELNLGFGYRGSARQAGLPARRRGGRGRAGERPGGRLHRSGHRWPAASSGSRQGGCRRT